MEIANMTTLYKTNFFHGWQETIRFQEINQEMTAPTRNPTKSFLTATTLIYAIGAGTAVAFGTRLALHWSLIRNWNCFHSICQIYAAGLVYMPAAFLGCHSHLSDRNWTLILGDLSKTWLSNTQQSKSNRTETKFSVAGVEPCHLQSYYDSPFNLHRGMADIQ